MRTVHPEFDPETRTWFVPEIEDVEAPTLRQLHARLGGKVQIVGWRPLGEAIIVPRETPRAAPDPAARPTWMGGRGLPLGKRPAPMPADAIAAVPPSEPEPPRVEPPPPPPVEAKAPVVEAPPIAPEPPPASAPVKKRGHYATREEARVARLETKKRYRERRKQRCEAEVQARRLAAAAAAARREAERERVASIAKQIARRERAREAEQIARREDSGGVDRGPWPAKSDRTPAWFRSRCSEQQNAALDLWAAGVSGPEISRRLGHRTNATVAAHWVPTARSRGDPRAVVRDPTNYGLSKRQPPRRRGQR